MRPSRISSSRPTTCCRTRATTSSTPRPTSRTSSSFWDESTWTDVGAYGAVAAACFTTPVGWAACGTATLLGSMGVLLSEADRQDEIDGAQHHLEEAQHDLDRAQALWTDRFLDYSGCVVHHMSKGADAGTVPSPDE